MITLHPVCYSVLAALSVALGFWFSPAQADGNWLRPEVIEWVNERYGGAAGGRVLEWQKLMQKSDAWEESDKLRQVNKFFNRLLFLTDMEQWGKNDYWATPLEALGRGGADCEDYSIAKYFTLREMGVPDEKMRIMYVKALDLDQAHMVLTYYESPGSTPLVLDNLNGEILPASRRPDLAPVYSFNGEGLWLAKRRGQGKRVGRSKRISLWQELKSRMAKEIKK